LGGGTGEGPYRYDRVAWCYQELAAAYSLGAIRAVKASQLEELAAGSRVLYAGVGRGEDALSAARRGIAVTGLDCSAAMLRRLRRSLDREAVSARVVQADFFEHPCFEHPCAGSSYDAVMVNFVLNIFAVDRMRKAIAQLGSLVRPGGKLLIADFAHPSGNAWQRTAVRAYYRPVNLVGWALGLCALHPLYDYVAELRAIGFDVISRRGFRPFVRGPVLYESLVATRPQ
jgi:demethylmenaquinone methyltransferase/2-methoxy-6-polyprenyl-1,4-benzoquinol methylase